MIVCAKFQLPSMSRSDSKGKSDFSPPPLGNRVKFGFYTLDHLIFVSQVTIPNFSFLACHPLVSNPVHKSISEPPSLLA